MTYEIYYVTAVSSYLTMDTNWEYDNASDMIADTAGYQLQYLNHAINFFIYILANNKFRYNVLTYTSLTNSNTYLPSWLTPTSLTNTHFPN